MFDIREVLSASGVVLAIGIGEFKELMDRGDGGSGFSFVDLAADFAGVKFAIAATTLSSASTVQNVLAGNIDEDLFFPHIKGLPEGLNKNEFSRKQYLSLCLCAVVCVCFRVLSLCLLVLCQPFEVKQVPFSV